MKGEWLRPFQFRAYEWSEYSLLTIGVRRILKSTKQSNKAKAKAKEKLEEMGVEYEEVLSQTEDE